MLNELPLERGEQLPDSTAVRPRLAALARRDDPVLALRLRLLADDRKQIAGLDTDEQALCHELAQLVRELPRVRWRLFLLS